MNLIKFLGFNQRIIHGSKNYSQMFPVLNSKDLIRKNPPETQDQILANIKEARNSTELLRITSYQNLETSQLVQTFKSLFSLQRSKNSLPTSEILRDPQFEFLCKTLRNQARTLELNDTIELLKVLNYLGIRADSSVISALLSMARHQVNELSLGHMLFLDFLFKKMDKTPLVEAFQIAIPMIFSIQLSKKLDHENVRELTELLHFVVKNKTSDQNVQNIITALTLHGESLNVDEARSCLWSICSLSKLEPTFVKLLQNCLVVYKQNIMDQTFDQMETTISKLNEKYLDGFEEFYDEQLCNLCVDYLIEKEIGFVQSCYLLKRFNRMHFVSIKLLDYLDSLIIKDPHLLSTAKPSSFFNFSAGFSCANYKSANWDLIKNIVHDNPLLSSERDNLPWLKFSLEMLCLGFHHKILIEKIFSRMFLTNFLSREYNLLDNLQLLQLYQCMKFTVPGYDGPFPDQDIIDKAIEVVQVQRDFPYKKVLEYIFGGENFVQTNVFTEHGQCLDHVVSFSDDLKPIEMPCEVKRFEDLPTTGVKSVAIFFLPSSHYTLNYPLKLRGIFDLRFKTLTALNIPYVHISAKQWKDLPDSEKYPFLEREVLYVLKKNR